MDAPTLTIRWFDVTDTLQAGIVSGVLVDHRGEFLWGDVAATHALLESHLLGLHDEARKRGLTLRYPDGYQFVSVRMADDREDLDGSR